VPSPRFGRKVGSSPHQPPITPGNRRLRIVPAETGPESPEALAISAMLSKGEFRPKGITVDDLSCYERLWNFCLDYQATSGKAPPLELVEKMFPDFEYLPNINCDWALATLRTAAKGRELRRRMGDAILALNDDDVDTALRAFDGLARTKGAPKLGMSIFDTTTIIDPEHGPTIPVPWQTCGRATGGIGEAEFWVLAARPSQGKSWGLITMGVHAAKAGYRVRMLSLEMRARLCNQRAQMVMAGKNMELQRMLRSDSAGERKDALEALAATMEGTFEVLDTSHGKVTIDSVEAAMADSDLVIVDHLGLMSTTSGNRSIEDWRVAAVISNQIKEATLSTKVPVLAASQINREGDNSSAKPPKLSQLSQTDAIGQDADVVITMRKLGQHAQAWSAEKVRNGRELRWWTDFRPELGKMGEITRTRAMEIHSESEDESD